MKLFYNNLGWPPPPPPTILYTLYAHMMNMYDDDVRKDVIDRSKANVGSMELRV